MENSNYLPYDFVCWFLYGVGRVTESSCNSDILCLRISYIPGEDKENILRLITPFTVLAHMFEMHFWKICKGNVQQTQYLNINIVMK